MTDTYHARLRGDRIEWVGAPPASGTDETPLELEVKIKERREIRSEIEIRQKMYDLLCQIAASSDSGLPEDPVVWQREIRRDRPLPGREDVD